MKATLITRARNPGNQASYRVNANKTALGKTHYGMTGNGHLAFAIL